MLPPAMGGPGRHRSSAAAPPGHEPLGLTSREHRRLGDVLLAAARQRCPIEPLTRRYPELTLGDASRIRDALLGRRLAAGERMIAVKRVGRLTSRMLLSTDAVPLELLAHPRVEPKLAFRLVAPLDAARLDAAELLAATDRVLPALEVLDSRYGSPELAPADDVADNGAAAFLRIGGGHTAPVDLAGIAELSFRFEIHDDGRSTQDGGRIEGTFTPAVDAVLAVARHLLDAGRPLVAGMLLLAPACAPPVAILEGTHVHFSCQGLGTVELYATTTIDTEEAAT